LYDVCRIAGLPEPTIEEIAGGIQITFMKDFFSEEYLKQLGLNERQVKAIIYTKKYREITNSKYQEVANVSKATATRDIKELEDKGLLKNIGTKGSSAIYILTVGS